ncbi:MAG TPA: alpha/beta hydrolase [Flavobacterium sp.]|nr:alpha/beta hydrolase [Flavobacterium sp.]
MNISTDFKYQTINLEDDYEGKVTSTLISSNFNTENRTPVLYIHGFIDYFFQEHLAEEFHNNCYDFYALELRKYGHSLLSHQHPNYCKSINEYFEEITFAIKFIYEKCQQKVVLIGHSTGGLITSLYMNNGSDKELVKSLVLNSPFFELNMPYIVRKCTVILAKILVSFNQFSKINNAISSVYGQSLHKNYYGEWDYNLQWKPIKGFPCYFAWLIAIIEAQKQLKLDSSINVPVLVMYSSKSLFLTKYNSKAHISDTVLNVEHIASIGKKLGNHITLEEIKNGMHDLFLSNIEVRKMAFEALFKWMIEIEK